MNELKSVNSEEEFDEVNDMSPSETIEHGKINVNISSTIYQYLKYSICEVFNENLDVWWEKENTPEGMKDNYRPDVMIICDQKNYRQGKYYGVPKFVVETLSPSTGKKDKIEKKAWYAKKGVSEYWIISPIEKCIEVLYLENGVYVTEDVIYYTPDENDNGELEITLRNFPHIKLKLKDIFRGV